MMTPSLAPDLKIQPAIKELSVEDVTIVMPVYNRIKYLSHYIDEGFWEGLNLQLVGDGAEVGVLNQINRMVGARKNVNLHSYQQNRGAAYARKTGISLTETNFVSFCDDDDFMTEAIPFLNGAAKKLASNEDTLFATIPYMYAFNESLNHQLQYDRRSFHGKTGLELLIFLVKTGEMCALGTGSVFRTSDIKGIYPESFFKVSEDYTFLARLCARFPERKVHVVEEGMYMRLVQEDSLTSKASYSLEKIVMHLVSMFVGAYHLFKVDILKTSMFQQILVERGRVLQKSYQKGAEAAKMFAGFLEGKQGPFQDAEQQQAFLFLQRMKASLPVEFVSLVGWKSSGY